MSDEIKRLATEEQRLIAELRDVREKLLAARIAATGLNVGDIVKSRRGVLHKIVRIDPGLGSNSRPWLYGNPLKKDGTYGIAERALYSDWEPVKPAHSEPSP